MNAVALVRSGASQSLLDLDGVLRVMKDTGLRWTSGRQKDIKMVTKSQRQTGFSITLFDYAKITYGRLAIAILAIAIVHT